LASLKPLALASKQAPATVFYHGAWAFAELWSHLPGYRWIAAALRRSRTLPLLDRCYALFARWRLRRLCASGACSRMTADLGTKRAGITN